MVRALPSALTTSAERPDATGGAGLWAPRWRVLTAGLLLTITLVAFEALAVITILPAVARDLGGIGLYGWVTSAFFLATLVGTVIAGEQTDRRGPAPPFAVGLLLFGAGLTLGGLAPDMAVLVAGRALQGLGAGVIPAVVYASIGRTYPESLRPRVFAATSTAWVVPGLIGPTVAAVVAEHASWRWVFLGLLPLVAASGTLAVRALSRIGPPPAASAGSAAGSAGGSAGGSAAGARARSTAAGGSTGAALRVSAGAGLVLAGLSSRSLWALPLIAAGLAVGLRPLLGLLPAGTLRARTGLPVAVLCRGLLTFTFFGADAYVPLAITSARHQSTAVAGVAVTAATLCWTAASWTYARVASVWTARRLITAGFAIVVTGIAALSWALSPGTPLAVAILAWGVAGFGIGLAYSPLALVVLRLTGAAHQGTASAALQLSDNLGVALGAGLGGVAVAAGAAAHWPARNGLLLAFGACGLIGVLGVATARRLPLITAPRADGKPAA